MAPSHNSKSSVSRWAVTLAALTTIVVGIEAFANTFPIVAWADRPMEWRAMVVVWVKEWCARPVLLGKRAASMTMARDWAASGTDRAAGGKQRPEQGPVPHEPHYSDLLGSNCQYTRLVRTSSGGGDPALLPRPQGQHRKSTPLTNQPPLPRYRHPSLSTLASTSPSSSSRSGTQASFSSDAAVDLCSLQSILLVSAPGLHHSDLSLLPTTPSGIRARLDYYADSSLTRAYVPLANGVLTTPERVARTFIKQCGALLQTDDYASFWQGNAAKTLRIETVQGLGEWELVGVKARQGRRELLNKIDEAIQVHLHTLLGPYLVVLTSLPEASTQALASNTPLTKRQALDLGDKALEIEEEALSALSDFEDALNETPAPSSTIGTDDPDTFAAQDRPKIDSVTDKAAQAIDAGINYLPSAFAPDPTSIFEVKPNSGLLHRHVFFTPALILCILISFLFLIPLLVFTSQALTTVQTVCGLEHKMTGSVGTDGSKGS